MAEIFLYRRDCGINPQQLQKLRREGFIPVGVEYLSDVNLLAAAPRVPQASIDLILLAASKAIVRNGGYAAQYFGEEMAKLVIAQAIEAGTAETGTGSVHESAVTEGHAPEPDSQRGSHDR